jgi:hypothetical protein
MSSSYSPNLRVELIGSGDQAGTWGTTTNNNFSYLLDTAIAGAISVTISTTPQALTAIQGPTATLASNQAVYATLKLVSAASAFTLYAPPAAKQYIVWNATSYTATIGNATALGGTTSTGGTTITLTAGEKALIWSDNTNFYKTTVDLSGVFGTLPIANGGTGQVTANAAFNALAPAQTSANGRYLKSDGTNTSWDAIDVGSADISGVLLGANGGTGVANTGRTITLGGNVSTAGALTTSGAFGVTLTATNTTSVTLPTTGTLATLAGSETLTNKILTSPTINSPTLTSPALGTPSSGNLANCTFPTLNQNTSGTAAGLSSTLAIASGGTGTTGFTAGYIHYGSFSTSAGLTYNGTDFTCGGNVTAYSDERLKTNWRDLPADFIEQLAKVKHGIYDRTDQEMTQVGVSAQSLQPVMPNAVIEDDGKMSVAYGNAAMVAAIKLAERVVALEAKIAELTKE